VLPCGEFVPAGQVLQVAAPADVLYLPAEQMTHVWPSGPEYPGLQRQSERLMLALGEEEELGQDTHDVSEEDLYVPAAHALHRLPSLL